MIVGFSTYSSGGGRGPVHYLTNQQSPDGTTRTPAPVVVRGDPELVKRLIDALDFAHTYTSGVLSFAPGEIVTPAMESRIMDAFEKTAFAGLEPERYSILWVRHQHAGHHELHFVTPRVELVTGKSLNIAPPGKARQELFDTFRSLVNAEYGLSDPDDPSRAQDVSLPNHLARLKAAASRQGQALKEDLREAITAAVRREVDAGRIQGRGDVVTFLMAQGLAVPRAGADYLTVLDAQTGQRVRLKGGLYRLEGWNPREHEPPGIRYGVPDPARAAELLAKLEGMVAARARFHRGRYGPLEEHEPQRARGPGLGPEPLRAYLARSLGTDALREVHAPDRRATRRMGAAAGKGGARDRDGRGIARRLAAFGDALSGARHAYLGAGERLDRAGRDLDRASGAVSAGAAALDPWLERQWWRMYYGHDQGMER